MLTAGATAQEGSAVYRELAPGVEIVTAAWSDRAAEALPPGAVALIAELHRELAAERRELLVARTERAAAWDGGALPGGAEGPVREAARGAWKVAPLPPDLLRRRVEITGPISDPKMVIQMLSRSEEGVRADAAMLDFEDSMKPSWENVVAGVENLTGAVDGTLVFERPADAERPAKTYRIDRDDMPLLMVRCRGLHLDESNLRVDGRPVSAGLLDLALTAWHTAAKLLAQGRTPKLYVPKIEHHLEARWWSRLLARLEDSLDLERGAVRATFLIETLPAALQVEEILWELREHAAGLNVGRWDKIFSDIKVLKEHRDRVLADRGWITMERPWMRDYARRLIQVCHRHGAFAMGGMAAFTPGRSAERRREQTEKVLADKRWEAALGHDGCWVSHPYFIRPALAAFERDHQLDVVPDLPPDVDLLPQGVGPKTQVGLRTNVRVGIAYLEGWSRDLGCIAWDDLMEDLATLEISRAQVWQWLRHRIELEDGTRVTPELVTAVFDEEAARIAEELREQGARAESSRSFSAAHERARAIFLEPELRPFLTNTSPIAGPRGADRPAEEGPR